MGISRMRVHIEANVSDRINLEDSVASVVHRNRGVRKYGVAQRRNGLLAEDFFRVF